MIGENKPEFAQDNPTPINQKEEIKIPEPPKESESPEKIVSPPKVKEQNKSVIKKEAKPNSEDKKPVAPKKEIVVKTPPKELQAQDNKPENLQNNSNLTEVWRLPIRENGDDFERREAIRSPIRRGKSLNEIGRIYLDISGDETFGRQIQEQISAEFLKNKSLTIVPKEKAEARLIIYVRRESDDDTASAIVRVVNAEGFVIYPNRKHVTGWKYIGQAVNLPKRIVQDLISAKANSKAVKK